MINALYAFTDCETSLAPNSTIIENNRPEFLSVKELLRRSAKHTRTLLKLELEIELGELEEKWHLSSLEKIFIENRIYRGHRRMYDLGGRHRSDSEWPEALRAFTSPRCDRR